MADAAQRELGDDHRAALAELTARHQQELESLQANRDVAVEAAKRAVETHRAALADAESRHAGRWRSATTPAAARSGEAKAAAAAARRAADDAEARAQAEREADHAAHAEALAELEAKHERAVALVNAGHAHAAAARQTETEQLRTTLAAEHARSIKELAAEHARSAKELAAGLFDELNATCSSAPREGLKRGETELASALQSVADRNAELRVHLGAIAERDTRIAELRREIEAIEAENTSYQEQVLRAYQKIKQDEAMVTRAKKAMAIALTVLDDPGNPQS